MSQDKIIVRGAREHNLKNITVEIPRDQLVVITGLSGSGKSSLAFDTIFAEGQRRYVESLSAYARQFLGQMEKPDVDQIEGLSPAVSIDQRSTSRNPRSTVGTVTEIYDYLRLLYARVGTPHCPNCGRLVQQQTAEQIIDAVLALPAGARLQVLAPLVKDRKGHHQAVFEDVRKAGFVRTRVDGRLYDVNEEIELDRYKNHTIEAVVDRLVIPDRVSSPKSQVSSLPPRKAKRARQVLASDLQAERSAMDFRPRLADSIETALRLGDGVVIINDITQEPPRDLIYSERLACPHCGISLPEFEPRTFSFNTPHGACSACQGLGVRLEFDPDLILSNPDLSLAEGAVKAWGQTATSENGYYGQMLRALAEHYHIPLDMPVRQLNQAQIDLILYGSGHDRIHFDYQGRDGRQSSFETTFEGVIPNLKRRYQETSSDSMRNWIESFMSGRPCETCGGRRLRPEALAVTVGGKNIIQITAMPASQTLEWVRQIANRKSQIAKSELTQNPQLDTPPLTERQLVIGQRILKEITARLQFMVDVGLDYLTLDRSAATLSGGEAQRIRLATQIGSQLMGVLYVLDEPSIGLHQRDQARLIKTLVSMRDLGNTLLVVEHDHDTIQAADWVIDLGPGAGVHGGEVVFEGTLEELGRDEKSLTGAYLCGRKKIPLPRHRREGNGHELVVRGATENNLKNIDVHIPLGKFVCITGVSGSGKSTLVIEVMYKRLAQVLQGSKERAGAHLDMEGVQHLDKVIDIDQSPIGRTPRSNPATYTGFFGDIRELFARLPESKVRGYGPGRFSFNVRGGRCEACEGQGQIRIEMQFLPDIFVMCDVCHGSRYNRETLQVLYKAKSIAQVLAMTVDEGLEFFDNIPKIKRKLKTLSEVGLGYITLGQSATTLSGGEAQRIKLSKELSRRSTGQTLYVLDEPSVGLHAADVHKLISVLGKLVHAGNTIVVIEHHPDIIKVADWIVDLGPEGGEGGGQIVAVGTPEEIVKAPVSYTGQFLKPYLK
ncbi:MAG: excinuclease ABC subunit UvrA [Thermoflexales bacterium]|nr:excinuclease ABC subunit UvrA [Thermoflexales bacterium]